MSRAPIQFQPALDVLQIYDRIVNDFTAVRPPNRLVTSRVSRSSGPAISAPVLRPSVPTDHAANGAG